MCVLFAVIDRACGDAFAGRGRDCADQHISHESGHGDSMGCPIPGIQMTLRDQQCHRSLPELLPRTAQ
jgi:hypothetical protein